MPVNNFEKQVQQKMDELQLRPSAEVWQEVERRIRKEKKRRWMVLFFIFAALLLGGTGWWIAATDKKPTSTAIIDSANIKNEQKNEAINGLTNEKQTTESDTEKNKDKMAIDPLKQMSTNDDDTKAIINAEKITSATTKINKRKISSVEKKSSTIQPDPSAIKENNSNAGKLHSTSEESTTAAQGATDKSVATNDRVIIQQQHIDSASSMNEKIAKQSNTDIITPSDVVVTKDTVQSQTLFVDNKNPYPIANDSISTNEKDKVAAATPIKIKKSKWEIGFTGMFGVSRKADAFSPFEGLGMNKSADVALNNPGGIVSGQGRLPSLFPVSPGKGNHWQLGAYAKRKLSNKTGLSFGLNFSSYSTIQETGTYIDAAAGLAMIPRTDFYVSGPNGTTHTNHYYYLQLPLAFHWQFINSKKLPFYWQNGLSTGLFLGGDALVYNATSNVFYKDNQSFNKLQLSFQSGVYTKLLNKAKHPLTAGVLYNYHFTRLQKTNIIGGNHLSSFGIQLGWLLKK